MAEAISIQGTTTTAKIRSPIAAFLLVFLTLGIYYLVWYYKINRELRDLGRAAGQEDRLGRSPFTSLMAISLGWLILVPPFVSMYRTLQRIQAAQEISGTTGEPINVWRGYALYLVGVFTFPVEIIYAQRELNRAWRTAPHHAAGTLSPDESGFPGGVSHPDRSTPDPADHHLSQCHPRRETMNTPAPPNHPTTPARRFSVARISLLVLIVAAAAFLLGRQDWGSSSLSFTNGVSGSGVAATQTRSLPSFRAIDLAGANTITVHVGAKQAVVVHAEDNLINRVKTDVRHGVLVVSERGSFAANLPLSVEVTVPKLDSARLMGSGTIRVEGVQARKFNAEVLGSGMLAISGTVDQLDASLAGSGNMQLGGLAARSVTATVPGSGRLEVQATHTLDASILGNGAIVYSGHPKTVNQTVRGSGAILPR